jgi:hypothetical protein
MDIKSQVGTAIVDVNKLLYSSTLQLDYDNDGLTNFLDIRITVSIGIYVLSGSKWIQTVSFDLIQLFSFRLPDNTPSSPPPPPPPCVGKYC